MLPSRDFWLHQPSKKLSMKEKGLRVSIADQFLRLATPFALLTLRGGLDGGGLDCTFRRSSKPLSLSLSLSVSPGSLASPFGM